MAKGRRRSNRARVHWRAGGQPSGSGTKQTTKKTENQGTGEVIERTASNGPQEPQGEWVSVEHRDADGNLTLPRELIAGTYRRRYGDVPDGTEIKVHVIAGYKPKALMLVERKIYAIHRLSVRGWRRIGQIAVEMEGWREHEGDWFTGMRGAKLDISDPGLPGPHNEESNYVVSKTSFDRKIVNSVDENGNDHETQLYEGTLDIKETWKSAWQRQKAEVLIKGFKYLLLPLLTALVASLAVWWIVRSPSPAGHGLETRGNPAGNAVRGGIDDSAGESPDKSVNNRANNVPAKQNGNEKHDPSNSVPKGSTDKEGATHDGALGLDGRPALSPQVEGDISGHRESVTPAPADVEESGEPSNE